MQLFSTLSSYYPTHMLPSRTVDVNDDSEYIARPVHMCHFDKRKKHSKVNQIQRKDPLHLTVPKRNYSLARMDSLRRYKISVIDEEYLARQKSLPSSVTTVFTLSCLFVVALIVLISGIIILLQRQGYAFDIFGYGFLAFGFITLCLCLCLQRKNIWKLMEEINKDVYNDLTKD